MFLCFDINSKFLKVIGPKVLIDYFFPQYNLEFQYWLYIIAARSSFTIFTLIAIN